METIVAKNLDFKKDAYSSSKYRQLRLVQQTGSTNVTISDASTQSVFEVPMNVVNFEDNELTFDAQVSALTSNVINYVYCNPVCPMIRDIKLSTRTGVTICEINDVNVYNKVVALPETNINDFMTKPVLPAVTAIGAPITGPMKTDNLSSNFASALPTNCTGGADYSKPNYTGVRMFVQGTANTADPYVRYQIKLGELCRNTALALNKDVYFGDIVNLTITWDVRGRVGFTDITGATAGYLGPAGNAQALGVNVSLTNLYLYLSVNNDPAVKSALMSKIASGGLSLLCSYVTRAKQNFQSGTSQTVTLRIDSSSMGRRLQKIYHSVFNNTETGRYAFDNSNLAVDGTMTADSKVVQYYTTLEDQREQDFTIDCSAFQDYLLHKKKLEGSAIQTAHQYKQNWFHCSDYRGDELRLCDNPENVECGMPINGNVKWTFNGAVMPNVASNHYSFIITQRILMITPGGIMWA